MMNNADTQIQTKGTHDFLDAPVHEIVIDPEQLCIPLQDCLFTESESKINQEIALALISTIKAKLPNCMSLSANQIGYNKKMFVYYSGYHQESDQHEFIVILNPKIVPIKSMGKRKYRESCLSYPATLLNKENMHCIRRYKKIKLFFQSIHGEKNQRAFTGKEGVMIQHEMDHMSGIIRF